VDQNQYAKKFLALFFILIFFFFFFHKMPSSRNSRRRSPRVDYDRVRRQNRYSRSPKPRRIRRENNEKYYSRENEIFRPRFNSTRRYLSVRNVLQIQYWERSPIDMDRKERHMDMLDQYSRLNREEWILNTTLYKTNVALEPNLFPYNVPLGVFHYTLWSRTNLVDYEVEIFVEEWLNVNKPNITAWAWDPSNLTEGMSIELYHVHVFFYQSFENQKDKLICTIPTHNSHKVLV
jgi:hypothetical protein